MADRQPALILCPETPYPAAGGGALRTASVVEFLARRYALDAIVFREPDSADPAATRLSGLARRVHVIDLPRHNRQAPSRALRNLRRLWRGTPPLTDRFSGFEAGVSRLIAGRRYAVAVVEHFWCAGYAPVLRPAADCLVLDLHNIESTLHRSCAAAEPWPVSLIHRKFAAACQGLEESLLPDYDVLLTTSVEDALRLRAIAPETRSLVYPNAIPFEPAPPRGDTHAVIFTGNLEYHPNVGAIRYFRDAIWPGLHSQWPSLRWRVAGKNPGAARRMLRNTPGVDVTGPMDDALAELAAAAVAVVPLRAGSGTRVKIVEAWAAATPVVSTRVGAEGLPCVPGSHILLADEPAGFAAAVSRLLESAKLRREIGEGGRRLYEQEFTWDAAWKKLEAAGF